MLSKKWPRKMPHCHSLFSRLLFILSVTAEKSLRSQKVQPKDKGLRSLEHMSDLDPDVII